MPLPHWLPSRRLLFRAAALYIAGRGFLAWREHARDPTPSAQTIYCKGDAQTSRIVSECASLHTPSFLPFLPFCNTWFNLVVFMLKNKIAQRLCIVPLRRQCVDRPDGGRVAIDWSDDEVTRQLPRDAPIVCILHTVTGSAETNLPFLRYCASKGWRGCVFARRGHTVPLRTPTFNVMGDADDTAAQARLVREAFPECAFMGMVGVSAGSGLLVTYLGKEGDRTPVDAACSLCPAYDINTAFSRLYEQYPIVDRDILKSMKTLWLRDQPAMLLREEDKAARGLPGARSLEELEGLRRSYRACLGAESVDAFVRESALFSDCPDAEAYFEVCGWVWVGGLGGGGGDRPYVLDYGTTTVRGQVELRCVLYLCVC